jgi:cobalamin-dependent methionine synthase I
MPIGADATVVRSFIETTAGIRDKHGINMTCGASNVSFGMPGRHQLGAAFLPMAMGAGLTSAILDARTPAIVESVELRRSNEELQKALKEVKVLRGLIPICASCKKIRNDGGFWQQLEEYLGEHSEAEFSHGLCQPCIKKLYPGVYQD